MHNVDGIIDEKTLVEIKAPYSAKNSQNAIEAVESGKVCLILHKFHTKSFINYKKFNYKCNYNFV